MDLPAPLVPDDVLSQPTRARLFALLSSLRRAAGTAELAERLELHPNGVRIHLDRLEEAGLVRRMRSPRPRGRPRDAWVISPDARPGGEAPHAYAHLGRWLARLLPADGGPRDIEAVGREIGREIAPRDAGSDESALGVTLSALGFQPHPDPAPDDRRAYRLCNCPYRDAARENREAICTLHRGMTQGLLDVLDPQATLESFTAADPDSGGCRIELAFTAAERDEP